MPLRVKRVCTKHLGSDGYTQTTSIWTGGRVCVCVWVAGRGGGERRAVV